MDALDLLSKDLTKSKLEIPEEIDDLFIIHSTPNTLYAHEYGASFIEKVNAAFEAIKDVSRLFPEFGVAIDSVSTDFEYDTVDDEYEEEDEEYEEDEEEEEIEEDEDEEIEEDEEELDEEEIDDHDDYEFDDF